MNKVAPPVSAEAAIQRPSVMIEKFATSLGTASNEFLDLNHTSKFMSLVSLMLPQFARDAGIEVRRTAESGH